MSAAPDPLDLRAEIRHRLDIFESIGHHSVLAAVVYRQRAYLAAHDAGDHAAAERELRALRVLVGADEPTAPPASPWRSTRCLILAACAVLLVFACVSVFALRLRTTDAETQLEMCRRGRAE